MKSALNISGSIMPLPNRRGDVLKMTLMVTPEIEERLLAGLSEEARIDLNHRLTDVVTDAGLAVSRAVREAAEK